MKITQLTVKDYLILEDVTIKPDSRLNYFVGKNREGKTSILKAIETGLRGSSDAALIRKGADKAQIMIDVEGLKIQRIIPRKGPQRLKVITEGGDIKANPQTFLNSLIGTYSFDPISFILMDSKERKRYLLDLFNPKVTPEILTSAGVKSSIVNALDYSQDGLTVLRNAEAIYGAERTEANRILKQKEAVLRDAEQSLGDFRPDEYVEGRENDISAAVQDLRNQLIQANTLKDQARKNEALAESLNAKINAGERALADLREFGSKEDLPKRVADLQVDITTISAEIAKLKQDLEDKKAALSTLLSTIGKIDTITKEIEQHRQTLECLTIPMIPDTDELSGAIDQKNQEYQKALADTALWRKYQVIKTDYAPEVEKLRQNHEALNAMVLKLRKDLPEKVTKDANMPITNLSFDGDRIMIGDTSLDNMSTSEQIGIALQIVKTLNKDAKLKVMCLDRIESLDDDTFLEFREQLGRDPDGWQYWITQVYHEGQNVPDQAYEVKGGKVQHMEQEPLPAA